MYSRKSLLSIPPPQQEKPAAYIMLGDVYTIRTSGVLNLLESVASHAGWAPWRQFSKEDMAIRLTMYLVNEAKKTLVAAGYKTVKINLHATSDNLKTVLRRPSTGAIIWISHGNPSIIYDSSGQKATREINALIIKKWALEFLQEKGIYEPPTSDPPPVLATLLKSKAHFGLNYFYTHTCLTMKDPSLALRMVDSNSRYEGYWRPKLAYYVTLTPAVSDTSNIEFPSVHDIMVVPDVTEKLIAEARLAIGNAGFTATIIEDKEDEAKAGTIYSQKPAPDTILNRKKDSKEVVLYAYKKTSSTDNSSTDTSLLEDDTKYIIWINQFGKAGRIHAGTVGGYKTPKKYTNEWLAGKSQEHLKKQDISAGQRFDDKKSAQKAACAMISNARYRGSLGWGRLSIGDFQGKTFYIDGLACEIKPAG